MEHSMTMPSDKPVDLIVHEYEFTLGATGLKLLGWGELVAVHGDSVQPVLVFTLETGGTMKVPVSVEAARALAPRLFSRMRVIVDFEDTGVVERASGIQVGTL
jgi:hypothetical protein